MLIRKPRSHTLCIAGCLLVLTCQMVPQENTQLTATQETSYHLDTSNRSVTQPIEPGLPFEPEKQKFIEIEVTEVINPKKHPLIFEVHYRANEQEKLFLGTFSLFPPDNPGKFIVATRGQLKNEGALLLSMVLPEEIDEDERIEVDLKKIKFRKK